ncbi:hypothetical protein [Phyllobacterium ifriqiyense]|uniref:hypothetical protein n=1 Tax=Phyllobacterium ifriqiyense TaxID=314238 RepID=UPI00339B1774
MPSFFFETAFGDGKYGRECLPMLVMMGSTGPMESALAERLDEHLALNIGWPSMARTAGIMKTTDGMISVTFDTAQCATGCLNQNDYVRAIVKHERGYDAKTTLAGQYDCDGRSLAHSVPMGTTVQPSGRCWYGRSLA